MKIRPTSAARLLMAGTTIRVSNNPHLFRADRIGRVRLVTERPGKDPLVAVEWPDLFMPSSYAARSLLVYDWVYDWADTNDVWVEWKQEVPA